MHNLLPREARPPQIFHKFYRSLLWISCSAVILYLCDQATHFLFSFTLPKSGGRASRPLLLYFEGCEKILAFLCKQVYTLNQQNDKTFCTTEYQDSSGQGAIPYRRYSPRADAFWRKQDSVKLRGRQYSLDERRMRGTWDSSRFPFVCCSEIPLGISDFLFFCGNFTRPEDSVFGTFFIAEVILFAKK